MIEADAHNFQEPMGPPSMNDNPAAAAGQSHSASGRGIPPRTAMQPRWKVRTPLWRRFTALFTLSFVSVVAGFLLAAALGITALLVLFVLERAIAT